MLINEIHNVTPLTHPTRGYTVQHFCKCMKMFPNISLCKTVEAKKDHPYSCFSIVLSNKEF